MKRSSLLLLGFILIFSAGAYAAEFSGLYSLAYPDLGLNLNFGITRNGEYIGFDEVIPLGDDAQAFFEAKKQEALALIESIPNIPDDVKNRLSEMVIAFFDSISQTWSQFTDQIVGLLPASFKLDQLFWPFDTTILVTLEELSIPWPGTIDPNTGDFTLMTMTPTLYTADLENFHADIIGLLMADGRIDRDQQYSLTGDFRADVEMTLEGEDFSAFMGVGLMGEMSGQRN